MEMVLPPIGGTAFIPEAFARGLSPRLGNNEWPAVTSLYFATFVQLKPLYASWGDV